ncbi:MAG: hypothetical protein KC495_13845 [Dehalococcoidia bacterium]|nr:hypothetical protein [Dehalococcoidia bacterium]
MAKPLLTDDRVREILAEPKAITEAEYRSLSRKGRRKSNRAFTEMTLEFTSESGAFRIHAQRHVSNALQFAIQLMYIDPDGNEYRLLRHAGRSGPHTNELERQERRADTRVGDRFRINRLTERYQASQYEEDGYAESAGIQFADFDSALRTLCEEAHITWPTQQGQLL